MLDALLVAQGGLSGTAGSSLEVVAADITQPATLLPDMFVGVTAAVLASAVKVSPKEGDTPDRQKYMQVSGVRDSAVLCSQVLLGTAELQKTPARARAMQQTSTPR